MEEWLYLVTKDVVVVIDAMALIVIVIGTIEAFFTGLRVALWHTAGSARSWYGTDAGWLPASPFSSRPISSRQRLRRPGRRSGSSALSL